MTKSFVYLSLSIAFVLLFLGCTQSPPTNTVKIGLITDLSGPASGYWGSGTRAGAQMAINELNAKGNVVTLFVEDYQLDPKVALTVAQKLVNANQVDAIYSDFNPAAVSVSSYLNQQSRPILHTYDAATTSMLEKTPITFKTYLDYQEGCKQLAKKFQQEGKKVGMLKINLEAGELCWKGVLEVFPLADMESYNIGDLDYKTQLLKLHEKGVQAVITVSFDNEAISILKTIQENDWNMAFGGVADSINSETEQAYAQTLRGGFVFGFAELDPAFLKRIQTEFPDLKSSPHAVVLAYLHTKQMVQALFACNRDVKCAVEKMKTMPADPITGFKGFQNRVAVFDMVIREF